MGMDTIPASDPMQNPPQNPLGGLDPADLLKQGVAEDTFMDGAATSFNPPRIEELAAIFPQFEILELIGKGGMGAVYKVRQKDLDRIVALKILPPAIGQSPEFSNRFTREAKALAKLNHPGIVTLHEFGQQDGLYFILMEFVDGVNLAQLMKTGRISPREALAIVPQICDALQFAHDQGIVHRDIKPENLLLDRSGRVKVADFGIAKLAGDVTQAFLPDLHVPAASMLTEAGKIIGTPQYMAPEQIDHPSEVDHRADIYALGVVFYQMLTGELPGQHLEAPSKKVYIDVRLDEIVLKAMEKEPELRYQQASVMKTRVETIAAVEKTSACAASPLRDKALRWVIHLIWAGCTSGLVALAIMFVAEILTKDRGNLNQSRMTLEDYYGPVITVLLGCGLLAIPIKAFRFASARVWIGAVFATAGITAITYVLAAPVADPAFHSDNFIVAVALCAFGAFLGGFAAVFGKERFSAPNKPSVFWPKKAGWIAAVFVVTGVLWLFLRSGGKAYPDSSTSSASAAVALRKYDWNDLAASGQAGGGVLVTVDGQTCLKIENSNDSALSTRLLTIVTPPLKAKRYAVLGEVRYENVQGMAYMEMWNEFPQGRFFSRTMDKPGSGAMGQLTGTSDWRPFSLPFDQQKIANPPNRIEVNLHLPGRGVVIIGPLRLCEIATVEVAENLLQSRNEERNEEPKSQAGEVTEMAEAWLSGIDAGDYVRSWNEAAVFFQKSITAEAWNEALTKFRKPLGAVKTRKIRNMKEAKTLPGAPDGKYWIIQFDTSFWEKAEAVERVTFMSEKDGACKAVGYFIQ